MNFRFFQFSILSLHITHLAITICSAMWQLSAQVLSWFKCWVQTQGDHWFFCYFEVIKIGQIIVTQINCLNSKKDSNNRKIELVNRHLVNLVEDVTVKWGYHLRLTHLYSQNIWTRLTFSWFHNCTLCNMN